MQPTSKDRQNVNHALKTLGFGGLEDPALVKQIAFIIRTHEHFRGVLMAVTPEQRAQAYRALAPNIPHFVPKPLDVYERETHEKAEREQWDIYDGTAYPKPFKVPGDNLSQLAQDAIRQTEHEKADKLLALTCAKCTLLDKFFAENRREADKKSYEAGWRTEITRAGDRKAYCPQHVPGRCSMTLSCSECEIKQRLRVWDEQDGYRAARRLGWLIGDFAKCPKCAMKPPVIE